MRIKKEFICFLAVWIISLVTLSSIQAQQTNISSDLISGEIVVCIGKPYLYKTNVFHANSLLKWEISGGILLSNSGDSIVAAWKNYIGTLYLYSVSMEDTAHKILVAQKHVYRYNPRNIVVTGNQDNNYYANSKQSFRVQYRGIGDYPHAESYRWKIKPNEAGCVVENIYNYNPVFLYNNTTKPRTTDNLLLEITQCGLSSLHHFNIPVNPMPISPAMSATNSVNIDTLNQQNATLVPTCSLSFRCNDTQTGYITCFHNTSRTLPDYSVAYDYLLDDTITASPVALVSGSVHTLSIRSRYNGVTNTSIPITFTVPTLPNAEFNADFTTACINIPITFTPLHTDHITDFLWKFDVSHNIHGTLLAPVGKHAYQEEGIHVVSLTATDQYGCKNTQMNNIFVVKAVFDVRAFPENSVICTGDTITLTGTIENEFNKPITCQWNDAQASNSTSITVYDTGTYIFGVTDAVGCYKSAAAYVFRLPVNVTMPKTN
jgi:PKD repeat protein